MLFFLSILFLSEFIADGIAQSNVSGCVVLIVDGDGQWLLIGQAVAIASLDANAVGGLSLKIWVCCEIQLISKDAESSVICDARACNQVVAERLIAVWIKRA